MDLFHLRLSAATNQRSKCAQAFNRGILYEPEKPKIAKTAKQTDQYNRRPTPALTAKAGDQEKVRCIRRKCVVHY